eukprot:468874-Pelagomonas_calceolata.AAC.1
MLGKLPPPIQIFFLALYMFQKHSFQMYHVKLIFIRIPSSVGILMKTHVYSSTGTLASLDDVNYRTP